MYPNGLYQSHFLAIVANFYCFTVLLNMKVKENKTLEKVNSSP